MFFRYAPHIVLDWASAGTAADASLGSGGSPNSPTLSGARRIWISRANPAALGTMMDSCRRL